MPYKDNDKNKMWNKGYFAGFRRATILHLGGNCFICGSIQNLEIHHKKPIKRNPRNLKDLIDLSNLELRCKKHHNGEIHK